MCVADKVDLVEEVVTGKLEVCWRCSGMGVIPHFSHVAGGVCFACDGAGSLPAGKAGLEDSGVWTFVVGGLAWQFESIHHYDRDPGRGGEGWHQRISPNAKGIEARVDSVMLQCFAVGGNRRTGTTLLHARVSPEVGRKVWNAARSGMSPQEMTDEYLEANGCSRSRNTRGINLFA